MDPTYYGGILRKLRLEKNLSQEKVANKLGITAQALSRWESGDRGLDVSDFVRTIKLLGHKPGDFLENSGSISSETYLEIQPLITALSELDSAERRQILKVVDATMGFREVITTQHRVDLDTTVSTERTEPRWTPEFPVTPEEFVVLDFDYPRELHAIEVELYGVAAGEDRLNPEVNIVNGHVLHDKDIRDTTHRVVVVEGDSMSGAYENGWRLLVDMRKQNPQDGDPVAVYIKGKGSMLGYWENSGGRARLIKENPRYAPVELDKNHDNWQLIGTVQKIVEAPARRRRK